MFKLFTKVHPSYANSQKIVSFWGLLYPDLLLGLYPWTPLGFPSPGPLYTGPQLAKPAIRSWSVILHCGFFTRRRCSNFRPDVIMSNTENGLCIFHFLIYCQEAYWTVNVKDYENW